MFRLGHEMDETVPAKPNVSSVTKAFKWITHELWQSLWQQRYLWRKACFLKYGSHDNGRLDLWESKLVLHNVFIREYNLCEYSSIWIFGGKLRITLLLTKIRKMVNFNFKIFLSLVTSVWFVLESQCCSFKVCSTWYNVDLSTGMLEQ